MRLVACGVASVCLLLLACSDSPLPGRVLGTYTVTGKSQTNSCGLGAPDPWTFSVQLSLQGSTLYWSYMDGSPLLSGPTSSSGQVKLTSSMSLNADSTDAGLGPCTLQRADDLELTLGSGSTPTTFSGTISYAYTPAAGASCSDVMSAAGGPFSALPCSVEYDVSATRN
jgi:hypothetical protein